MEIAAPGDLQPAAAVERRPVCAPCDPLAAGEVAEPPCVKHTVAHLLPTILIYLAVEKYLVQGMTARAVMG